MGRQAQAVSLKQAQCDSQKPRYSGLQPVHAIVQRKRKQAGVV